MSAQVIPFTKPRPAPPPAPVSPPAMPLPPAAYVAAVGCNILADFWAAWAALLMGERR